MTPPVRVGFCGAPTMGGPWTVCLTLREEFLAQKLSLKWIGLGGPNDGPDPGHEGAATWGAYLRCAEPRGREGAALFCDHVAKECDALIVNIFSNVGQMNAVRFLPEGVLRVGLVHSISRATYAAAAALAPHLHAFVAPSPRIVRDLGGMGMGVERIHLIPHGVPIARYATQARAPQRAEPLRLIYLGRVEEQDKGVFLLPKWLSRVLECSVDARLTVAGDGPDRAELESRFASAGLSDLVDFLGETAREDAPALLARHHALLAPSHFEGFGLVLVEAMAAGCVPIGTLVEGTTDFIVKHGQCGMLFPRENLANEGARAVASLADPLVWTRLSHAARERAEHALSAERMGAAWGELLNSMATARPGIEPPLSLDQWDMHRALRPSAAGRFLPEGVKRVLRKLRGQ